MYDFLIKKAIKSSALSAVLIVVLWGTLYHLTDSQTIASYFQAGVAVCILNTLIFNLKKRKIESLFRVHAIWVILAGFVLVLYHAGFVSAAIFAAAAIFVSPFFWADIYEGVVGATLIITLIKLST